MLMDKLKECSDLPQLSQLKKRRFHCRSIKKIQPLQTINAKQQSWQPGEFLRRGTVQAAGKQKNLCHFVNKSAFYSLAHAIAVNLTSSPAGLKIQLDPEQLSWFDLMAADGATNSWPF